EEAGRSRREDRAEVSFFTLSARKGPHGVAVRPFLRIDQPKTAGRPSARQFFMFGISGAYAFSNAAATFFSSSRISRCCGHSCSHWPQRMQSDALPCPSVVTR